MTLMELMVVVVIVGVLAAVATVAYMRNLRKAHSSEVPLVFGEIQVKQEQFAVENGGQYQTLGWMPAALNATADVQEPITAPLPAAWTAIRFQSPKPALYCRYRAFAGLAATNPAGVGSWGTDLFPTPPGRNWYFTEAECNFEGDAAGLLSGYAQRGDNQMLRRENDGF